MGGCRCTYRNCTVKTDGKTHMFHYPVFEKVRCHQWLTNAQRLDFLNLKVSQLKNRVVCQHHFKDENFMNFKKDKLTFDAIPTEDGPYCDSTNYVDLNLDSSNFFSIIIDDTENDFIMGNDKKANYSIKYGDFLANLDLMDIEKPNGDSIDYKNLNVDIMSPHKRQSKSRLINDDASFTFNISLPTKSDKNGLKHPTLAVSPYMKNTNLSCTELHYNEQDTSKCKKSLRKNETKDVVSSKDGNVQPLLQEQNVKSKESKIKIISEKKITEPLPITGKFESVSPNFVLNVSKIKNNLRKNDAPETYDKINKSKNIKNFRQEPFKVEIEIDPVIKEVKPKSENITVSSSKNSIASEKSFTASPLKPKVPPERLEAINKKRKFNMKLRDMVESCLNKLDNCDKADEIIKQIENPKSKVNKTQPQHERNLPKSSYIHDQEYTVAFLESRIKEMENTLLRKIEQNSKKIGDLKETFLKSSQKNESTALCIANEEVRKKQLFQELSKYLSPSTKSLIYEELFIDKVAIYEPKISPKNKRRRCT